MISIVNYMLQLGRFLSVTFPTASQMRRQVSTTVAGTRDLRAVETVAKHLSHLPQTSFRYWASYICAPTYAILNAYLEIYFF